MKSFYDIIVIGAGPAGMAAALSAAEKAPQCSIHGDRPSGVFTAGQAQTFINLKGYLPCKRFVILGSGDIGLIMARRLTLETASIGGNVEGFYEVKSKPSGLTRNIVQCLEDYSIPLHFSTTVSALHGTGRLEGVTVTQVDGQMRPVAGTERYIPCDTLILSVGLIPENDILDSLAPAMDARTKGPQVNQYMETTVQGLFSCGNALHVNDLVDYVSESGSIAGERAALRCLRAGCTGNSALPKHPTDIPICADHTLLYQTPARIVPDGKPAVMYFRSATQREHAVLTITAGMNTETNAKMNTETNEDTVMLFQKTFRSLKPPEMERILIDIASIPAHTQRLSLTLTDAGQPHRA